MTRPASRLSIPLIDAFNPFETPQQQTAAAKAVSNQLADWLQRLRTDLIRPFSTSGGTVDSTVGSPNTISTIQTHPYAGNATQFGQLPEVSVAEAGNEKDREKTLSSDGVQVEHQSRPVLGDFSSENDGSEAIIHPSTSVTVTSTESARQDKNGTAENTENYYDGDFGVEKIPEAEESDETTVKEPDDSSGLLERKVLGTELADPIQTPVPQTKV
ncbi:unnamed protein product [Gongylonema pulchrum]|uniref:Uncharacterized protein n=1 Tax=Gongylonema pulchrum TaxID=637853 RepID=A0A183CWH6_9BILA|nr:unnamed protein product [Gongylonema pulchrum]